MLISSFNTGWVDGIEDGCDLSIPAPHIETIFSTLSAQPVEYVDGYMQGFSRGRTLREKGRRFGGYMSYYRLATWHDHLVDNGREVDTYTIADAAHTPVIPVGWKGYANALTDDGNLIILLVKNS